MIIIVTIIILSLPMTMKDNFSSNDSIALRRFNAILLHESFESDVDPDLSPTSFFLTCLAFNPRNLYYCGYEIIIIITTTIFNMFQRLSI